MKRKIKTSAAISLAVMMATGLAAAPVSAAEPVANGCPAGFELLSVAELTQQGYQLPILIDDPTSGFPSFGQPGNGDGWVCGVPLHHLTFLGLEGYNFLDNNLQS